MKGVIRNWLGNSIFSFLTAWEHHGEPECEGIEMSFDNG